MIETELNEIAALYRIWYAMLNRCLSPRNRAYKNYGGRGITVCPRWQNSFGAFVLDVGPRPSNAYSLDRRDNDLGYSKRNCQWATKQEQNDNRRDTIKIHGKPLSYWVKETGLKKHTLDMRIRAGWSLERALNPALAKRGPKPQSGELPCL